MNKLATVIQRFSAEFQKVLERRSRTSMCSKKQHLALLQAVVSEDIQRIEEVLLGDEYYFLMTFERVICCLDVDNPIKRQILEEYAKAYHTFP